MEASGSNGFKESAMRLNLPVVVATAFLLAACSTASDDGADSGSGGDSAAAGSGQQQAATTPAAGAKPGSQLDLEINVGDRVFFDFDKSTLRSNGRTTIEGWAAWLKTYPANKVTIEGHADERGTREYNLALGERRANASREYLISLGVDPNRVKTISYGKERPAIPGSNENAYAQNRRSVAVLDAN
jgi:peptidoglycan-associated lipoprotein